jgi:hypothetical protein
MKIWSYPCVFDPILTLIIMLCELMGGFGFRYDNILTYLSVSKHAKRPVLLCAGVVVSHNSLLLISSYCSKQGSPGPRGLHKKDGSDIPVAIFTVCTVCMEFGAIIVSSIGPAQGGKEGPVGLPAPTSKKKQMHSRMGVGATTPVRKLVFVICIVKHLNYSEPARPKKHIHTVQNSKPLSFLLPAPHPCAWTQLQRWDMWQILNIFRNVSWSQYSAMEWPCWARKTDCGFLKAPICRTNWGIWETYTLHLLVPRRETPQLRSMCA